MADPFASDGGGSDAFAPDEGGSDPFARGGGFWEGVKEFFGLGDTDLGADDLIGEGTSQDAAVEEATNTVMEIMWDVGLTPGQQALLDTYTDELTAYDSVYSVIVEGGGEDSFLGVWEEALGDDVVAFTDRLSEAYESFTGQGMSAGDIVNAALTVL